MLKWKAQFGGERTGARGGEDTGAQDQQIVEEGASDSRMVLIPSLLQEILQQAAEKAMKGFKDKIIVNVA